MARRMHGGLDPHMVSHNETGCSTPGLLLLVAHSVTPCFFQLSLVPPSAGSNDPATTTKEMRASKVSLHSLLNRKPTSHLVHEEIRQDRLARERAQAEEAAILAVDQYGLQSKPLGTTSTVDLLSQLPRPTPALASARSKATLNSSSISGRILSDARFLTELGATGVTPRDNGVQTERVVTKVSHTHCISGERSRLSILYAASHGARSAGCSAACERVTNCTFSADSCR